MAVNSVIDNILGIFTETLGAVILFLIFVGIFLIAEFWSRRKDSKGERVMA